jgi:hypothetical protein
MQRGDLFRDFYDTDSILQFLQVFGNGNDRWISVALVIDLIILNFRMIAKTARR